MDLSLQSIGSFQFENLFKNRIPFLLIHFNQDFSEIFASYLLTLSQARMLNARDFFTVKNWFRKNVLRSQLTDVEITRFIEHLKQQQFSNDFAVVTVSEDGSEAAELTRVLTENGFTNVFNVEGGMATLRSELKK